MASELRVFEGARCLELVEAKRGERVDLGVGDFQLSLRDFVPDCVGRPGLAVACIWIADNWKERIVFGTQGKEVAEYGFGYVFKVKYLLDQFKLR